MAHSTSSSWEKALVAAMQPAAAKPVPAGWVTVRAVSKQQGISYGAAHKKVDDALRRGLLERKQWPNPAGVGSPCYIYRPKKK